MFPPPNFTVCLVLLGQFILSFKYDVCYGIQRTQYCSYLTSLCSPSVLQACPNVVQQTLNKLKLASTPEMELGVVRMHTGHGYWVHCLLFSETILLANTISFWRAQRSSTKIGLPMYSHVVFGFSFLQRPFMVHKTHWDEFPSHCRIFFFCHMCNLQSMCSNHGRETTIKSSEVQRRRE